MQTPAMIYLLDRQKERIWLEQRALSAVYLASLLLGCFMAWLLHEPRANPVSIATPWGAMTGLALLIMVRSMSDGSSLHQLLVGGAWREIRLSRLRSTHVVFGILLNGLRQQLAWGLVPALCIEAGWRGHGLHWFGALTLGSALGSVFAQLSVVQRVVSAPRLTRLQLVFFVPILAALSWMAVIDWGLAVIPSLLTLAALLFCLTANALDSIPEGCSLEAAQAVKGRWGQWLPWNDNPIVARECARESFRLGGGWLTAGCYFFGWGVLLAALPVVSLGLTYYANGEWPVPVRVHGAYYLAAFVLVAGLLQSFRAAQRVFRALAEERDRQTLDLLVVTSLQPDDFVDGWAQVGYTTRQLEMAGITLVSLLSAYLWSPPLTELALIVYAGLVTLGLCAAGAYCGLLLGFRHCARIKRRRHMLFPLAIFAWVVFTAPLFYASWAFLLLQAAATYLIIQASRKQAMAALIG